MRRRYSAFGRGIIYWMDAHKPDGSLNTAVLVFIRKWQNQRLLIIHNLSRNPESCKITFQPEITWTDMFNSQAFYDELNQVLHLKPYEYLWLKI